MGFQRTDKLTLKNRNPVAIPIRKMQAATIFGRAYGNLSRNVCRRGFFGSVCRGFAKAPPRIYMIDIVRAL